jgi:hypothetical protein
MDDSIFDDVDAILSEDITNDEDKNFNEAELQDIMSEIENLEKEFVGDIDTDVETDHAESEMSLQEKIDAELAMELDAEKVQEEIVAEVKTEVPVAVSEIVASVIKPQVINFEKPAPVAVPTEIPNSSEVSFAAHGQMSFNLDFKVGQETAKLTVDPVKGLLVTVAGVEFCISEDSGCTVSMENGMKFTIPLSNQSDSLKKKAA